MSNQIIQNDILTSVEGKNLIAIFIIVIIITIGDYNKKSIKLPNRALHAKVHTRQYMNNNSYIT